MTLPVCVPTAINLARCPGTSVELTTGPVADMGVSDGEEAVDRPENPSNGSSHLVCTAYVEQSIVVAVIWTVFSFPNESVEVRHSSIKGFGVIEPLKSSGDELLPMLSVATFEGGGKLAGNDASFPNIDDPPASVVLGLLVGGVAGL